MKITMTKTFELVDTYGEICEGCCFDIDGKCSIINEDAIDCKDGMHFICTSSVIKKED